MEENARNCQKLSDRRQRILELEKQRTEASIAHYGLVADLQRRLLDMTDRYHAASGEADRLHDQIAHADAYKSTGSASCPTCKAPPHAPGWTYLRGALIHGCAGEKVK